MRRQLHLGSLFRSLVPDHLDHLWDDVSRPAHEYRVTDADIQPPYLVHVVQCGVADGHPADEDRFQARNRGDRTGSTNLPLYCLKHRQFFLSRKLVGYGPAGDSGDEAQLLLQVDLIDLEHDAIDFIGQAVPLFQQILIGLQAFFRAGSQAHFRVDTEAPFVNHLQGLVMAIGQYALVRNRNAVGTHFQRPPGGYTGILLPKAAGGGVAWVNEGFFTLVGQSPVQGFKAGAGHVHLTANFYHLRQILTS